MRRLAVLLVVFLFGNFNLLGQSVHFYFTDGSVETYALADVSSFNFEEDVMNLNTINGTTISWNVSVIQRYEYDDLNLSIENEILIKESPLRVYPNPSKGSVSIEFELNRSETTSIDIYDLNGKSVMHLSDNYAAGTNTVIWDGTDLSANSVVNGSYVCRIITDTKTMTHKIVMTR
ncbi:MAG: T9SS type A sorting domain-containing protein [Bacteroidetes bacterium]|nr:T9SS type A sorting domain-containing protein [Bacteroidota bacterium]